MRQHTMRWLLALGLFSMIAVAVNPVHAAGETSLVGLAMHRETGRDIYVGALLSEQALVNVSDIASATGTREMEFRIVARRTSIRSLLGGILLQAEVATGTAPSTATVEFANAIMGAVDGSLYTNDSFTLRSTIGGGTTALVDGQPMASSQDGGVFGYFLAGWISEKGSSTAFRNTLLAADIDIDLRATYGTLQPSAERIASVSAWQAPEPEAVAPQPVAEQPRQQVAAITPESAPVEPSPAATEVAQTETKVLLEEVTPVPAEIVAATEAAAAMAPADAASTPSIAMARPKPVVSDESEPAATLARETVPDDPNDITQLSIIEYSQRLAAFNSLVFRMVNGEIRYPRAAIRRGIQGALELDVTLGTQGNLLNVAVARSSGHSMLDKSAIKAAEEAFENPLTDSIDKVAFAEYSGDGEKLVIPVPVNFVLTE